MEFQPKNFFPERIIFRQIASATLLLTLATVPAFASPTAVAVSGATTNLAIAEYNRENYEEALQTLTQAKQTEGASAINDYYTGLCKKESGDYQGAVKNFSAALSGSQPLKKGAVDLVSTLFNLERYDEAMNWVQWAEREGVNPREVAYLKGQILMKQKHYDEAVASFGAAKGENEETDQQIGLQVASAHAENNDYKAAREALQAVISRNPNSDAASFAKEYDQKLSVIKPAKRFGAFIGINFQYDDNVTTANTGKKDDVSIGENFRFEYDALLAQPWSFNAQYSIVNNSYLDRNVYTQNSNDRLNLATYSMLSQNISFTPGYRSGNHVFTIPVSGSFTHLDYRSYSTQVTTRPTDTYIINQEQLLQTSVSYSHRNMLQSQPYMAENRDADIYAGQLGYIQLFAGGNGMLNLRGEVAYEDTKGNNWKNFGKRIGADALLPLAEGTRLILSSEGFFQSYDNKNNLYNDVRRSDTTVSASATINQQITPLVYLNLQYSFNRVFSNISAYDYQRNLVTSGLEVRF